MRRSDFYYALPPGSIAQHPLDRRSDSRLLILNGATGQCEESHVYALADLLRPDDLLVFNDTRVIPARLTGRKVSGGRVEILVERLLPLGGVLAHLKASNPPSPGSVLRLAGGAVDAKVEGREGALFVLTLTGRSDDGAGALTLLQRHGQVPLPPYIKRAPLVQDSGRYQTIFARRPGAAAAPTAGLHFDEYVLEAVRARGVEIAYLTLHVGAGTFQPVRTERVEDHEMHAEHLEVDPTLCAAVERAQRRGGRVVAAGTTVVRALESAAEDGWVRPFTGASRLFIYPGYRFRVVDAMLTNFHLPESTLLMLVCAFAGRTHVIRAYEYAVKAGYRFFSYGDAMFVTPCPEARRAL